MRAEHGGREVGCWLSLGVQGSLRGGDTNELSINIISGGFPGGRSWFPHCLSPNSFLILFFFYVNNYLFL